MLDGWHRKHGQPCGVAGIEAADRLGGGPADGAGVAAAQVGAVGFPAQPLPAPGLVNGQSIRANVRPGPFVSQALGRRFELVLPPASVRPNLIAVCEADELPGCLSGHAAEARLLAQAGQQLSVVLRLLIGPEERRTRECLVIERIGGREQLLRQGAAVEEG
jgi:hypothetical protein